MGDGGKADCGRFTAPQCFYPLLYRHCHTTVARRGAQWLRSTHGDVERQLLDSLSRTPFVDSTEMALILGEPLITVHRTLANLLAGGIVGRASHGTAHPPSSQRYHLTTKGIREATRVLSFDTPSEFVFVLR